MVSLDRLSFSEKNVINRKIEEGGQLVLKHQHSTYQSLQSSTDRSHICFSFKKSELLGSQIMSQLHKPGMSGVNIAAWLYLQKSLAFLL